MTGSGFTPIPQKCGMASKAEARFRGLTSLANLGQALRASEMPTQCLN